MKKRVLVVMTLCLLCGLTTAQKNDSFADRHAVISMPDLHVLYFGLINLVDVTVPGHSQDSIYCELDGVGNLSGEKGKYEICADSENRFQRTTILKIYIRKQDQSLFFIESYLLKFACIPKPDVFLGSKLNGNNIFRGELKLTQYLRAALLNFAIAGIGYQVTGYHCTYIPADGEKKYFTVEGQRISPGLTEIFFNCNPGDRFIFTEITARMFGGRVCKSTEIRLNPAVYEIK